MCSSTCSKCFRLRNDIDLRNSEPKYKHCKDQYAPKCPLCKLILPQIHNLVRDISVINIKDIPGICNHCKNINSTLQCERCDFILKAYMQEKECYVDHCNKECHEVIARIKTLLSEFEKHEELMKLKSLSLDELLKFLKPLKKTPNVQHKETQRTDSDIQGGTHGFRSSCVCEDLLKKLQEKMASIDYKNYSKLFIDSKTPSHQVSYDRLDKTKKIEKQKKYGKSFNDGKIPSRDIYHDQLEKSKNIERKHKNGKSFDESKIQSHDISSDQLDKTKDNDRKQKKTESNKIKDPKESLDYISKEKRKHGFKKQIKSTKKEQQEGEISKLKGIKDAIGFSNYKDKHKPEFKKTVVRNVKEKSNREKKGKSKKQSDNIKENEFSVDSKKIKVHNKSLDELEKMILNRQKKRKRDPQYNIKRFKIPDVRDLPPLPVKKFKEHASMDSESIIECDQSDEKDFIEVIEGNKIVRYKRGQSRVEPKTKKPLFFNVTHNFDEESLSDMNLRSAVHSDTKPLDQKVDHFML